MERNEVQRDWHRIDIVAELHKRGVTMRGLSASAGLKPDTLKNALARPYPNAARIVAKALNSEPARTSPRRYTTHL